jgi:RNA polymerase sigma-70 factor (ECF subfamily)
MTPPAAEDRPDEELLRAHVAGDPDAFGVLFARHRDRLWAVAVRTTGDPDEAADALQDALVSAFRRAASFRGESAVTTWLHRIVVNACLDRLRRRAVRRTEPLPDDLDDRSERRSGPVPASAGVVDPADLAVDHERRAAVLAALATLPPEQRAALVLVDLEGCSVEETATLLGCAPGTVKSRCSRGRARLLPLLLDHRPAGRRQPTGPDDPTPRGSPTAGNPGAPSRVEPSSGSPAPPGLSRPDTTRGGASP